MKRWLYIGVGMMAMLTPALAQDFTSLSPSSVYTAAPVSSVDIGPPTINTQNPETPLATPGYNTYYETLGTSMNSGASGHLSGIQDTVVGGAAGLAGASGGSSSGGPGSVTTPIPYNNGFPGF